MEDKSIPTHDPQTGELNPYYEELTGKKNHLETKKNIKTRSIKDMTEKEFFHIANIATGGWFTSDASSEHKEVETGGYGWRRRVEWIQNTERYDEYHYFEITGEYRSNSWAWSSKSTYEMSEMYEGQPNWGKGHLINTLNPMKIVDYCREQELDIENKHGDI